MLQKADKGIEKTENEQRRLAHCLHVVAELVKQRKKKGKLK